MSGDEKKIPSSNPKLAYFTGSHRNNVEKCLEIMISKDIWNSWLTKTGHNKLTDPPGFRYSNVNFVNKNLLEKSYYWRKLDSNIVLNNYLFRIEHSGLRNKEKKSYAKFDGVGGELVNGNTKGHRYLFMRTCNFDIFRVQIFFPCDRNGVKFGEYSPIVEGLSNSCKKNVLELKNLEWKEFGGILDVPIYVFPKERMEQKKIRHHSIMNYNFSDNFPLLWSFFRKQQDSKRYILSFQDANNMIKKLFFKKIEEKIHLKTDKERVYIFEFAGIFIKDKHINVIVNYHDCEEETGIYDKSSEMFKQESNPEGKRFTYRERVVLNFHIFHPTGWKYTPEYSFELDRRKQEQKSYEKKKETEETEGEIENYYFDNSGITSPNEEGDRGFNPFVEELYQEEEDSQTFSCLEEFYEMELENTNSKQLSPKRKKKKGKSKF